MKKLKREAAKLKAKSVASFRRGTEAFNGFDNVGRQTGVLLHYQHAFEMLLKAGLVQAGQKVFDSRSGRAIGMDRCVNLGREHLKLSGEECGTILAIDALRDDEQHWLASLSEGLLYVHCRAAVTLFDELLERAFDDRLLNHLPERVLPISSEPPRDIQVLLDEEYSQIRAFLAPRKRKRPEARAKIRGFLAMEAHSRGEPVQVSKQDVDRVERAVRKGGTRDQVFPALTTLGTDVSGEGLMIRVRIVKTSGALPVRLVPVDSEVEAGAVREVDLQNKYHWSKQALSDKLGLTAPKCAAIRSYLGIETDPTCFHDFVFGRSTHRQYSDNALKRIKEAMDQGLDVDAVWRNRRTSGGRTSAA